MKEYIEELQVEESGWTEMPYAYALVWISYSFLLLVEKVIFDASTGHSHGQGHSHHDSKDKVSVKVELVNRNNKDNTNQEENIEEETIRNVISNKGKLASFLHRRSGN